MQLNPNMQVMLQHQDLTHQFLLEIYNLELDIGEETNLASRQQKLTEEFEAVMKREHAELKQN